MVHDSHAAMRYPFNQKALQTLRLKAASMADVDVSESTHSTIAGDENEQPRLLMSQGNCVYSKSFGKNVGHLPSVPEESGVYSSESTDSAIYQNDMMGSDHGEVQKLNEIASGYALRGDEQTAIDIYKRALVFAAGEVDMIKSRIENTSREPEYLKDAIYQMLFREWTDMSLSIAETKTMMAVLYERMGDYDCAIEVCNEAKDVYERQLLCDSNDQSELYASVEEKFSLINHMNEKLSGARETYQARRHLHETAVRIHSELKSIMDCDQRRVLFDAMLNKLSEALQLEMESLGQYHPQVAETLAFISKIQLEKNDATEALRSIEQAVKTAEIALGTKHPNTGEKYYELARQFERLNREKCDRTNAITFYEKALETLGEAEGDHSRILGAISNDMGVLLLQEGRHDEALEKLTDALEVYDSIEAPHSDAMYADTAQILRNLAKCYVRRKEWDQAAVNFSAALDAQHQARKQFEAKVVANPTMEMPLPIHDETIADTMKRLGKVYTAMHQYEKADKILLDALTIFQNACEYFKANSKKVTRLELAAKQDQLANIVFCLAKVKEATHNFDEAIRLYDEALELRIYSDKVRKKTEKVNHVHIAMCLAGIGKMRMAKGDCVIAFKAFNEAIQNARKEELPEYHPIVQMLWEHSRIAAKEMQDRKLTHDGRSEEMGLNPLHDYQDALKPNEDIENRHDNCQGTQTHVHDPAWFNHISRLEGNALASMVNGDIDGALEVKKHLLELRWSYLAQQKKNNKPIIHATQQVAQTLVGIAHLHLILEHMSEAETLFRDAIALYKLTGLSKESDCIREIKQELDRLKGLSKNRQYLDS